MGKGGKKLAVVVMLLLLIGGIIYGFVAFSPSQNSNENITEGATIMNEKIDDTSPRTDSLFKEADRAVYQLARKIEREEPISADEVKTLPEGTLNARYGSDITLLFHALSSYNLQAIDVLLGNGSDPHMTDQAEYSGRDFTYYMATMNMHARPDLGQDFKTELIRLYLKHGGDPNHRLPSRAGTPFFYYVALMENYDAVEILLEAGANPLAGNLQGSAIVAHTLARRYDNRSRDILKYIVCRGYFDFADSDAAIGILRALAPRGPTNPVREKIHRTMAMRILEYHPDFDENDWSIKEIFGGPIPWKEILETDYRELCNEQ